MDSKEFKAALKELMDKFDYYRLAWIENYGTDKGYNEWFNNQIKAGV